MSIIHDALKKVQQSLSSKTHETKAEPSTPPPSPSSAYIYATPPAVETLTQPVKEVIQEKSRLQNKAQSALTTAFIILITAAITVASINYLYQQFRDDIPGIQRMAKKSFYKLIHKQEVPDFKSKTPEELKPLAQLTIPPPVSTALPTAATTTAPLPPAPSVTLNVHGIMSNATGNLALINDHVYQEGDEVGGAKIVKINLDSITVDINGTEKIISVKD